MLKSNLWDYRDAYIPFKGKISVAAAWATPSVIQVDRYNKKEIYIWNCVRFPECVTEINNTQVDKAKDLDIVIPMSKLIEYSDNYWKISGSLNQFCRDEP